MHFYRYIFCILSMCLLLSACTGRQVNVVQAHQFKLMADRMPNELIARDILDSSRNYTPAMWQTSSMDYGQLLYERLKADFLFDDKVDITQGLPFAQLVRAKPKENSVQIRRDGFSITNIKNVRTKKSSTRIERRVDVDMVAITDWDGDGNNDWLVAGKLLKTRGAIARIYYVVIFNPPATGRLNGSVVGVYEDMGVVGRLYMRDSIVKSSSQVEDVVPGLKPVTKAPESVKPSSSSIEERELD